MNTNIGIGYNPILIKSPELIPGFVDYIECGPHDIDKIQNSKLRNNLSVHIARSPISENCEEQRNYAMALKSLLAGKHFVSIGFHVTGPRSNGIGLFGFSSHYDASSECESHAINFIKLIQDTFSVPVWVENVNFYSDTRRAVFSTHESINRICHSTSARQIADLTHLFVDAHNVGIDPPTLVGSVDWSSVAEVHLAGVVESRGGALHDGHSNHVPAQVWDLYKKVCSYDLIDGNTIVTIEHTDPLWSQKADDYKKDYVEALKIRDDRINLPFELDPRQYAVGYIKRKLRAMYSRAFETAAEENLPVEQWLSEWIDMVETTGVQLVLSKYEADMFWGQDKVEYYGDSFARFCDAKLGK